jgi:hypothetical protein
MTAFGDLSGLLILLASCVIHGFFAILLVASAASIRGWVGKRLPA